MIATYEEVARRIDDELADLERCVVRARRSWSAAGRADQDQDAFVDSVALNLQSFYTGLERLFEIICREVDGAVPTGETWHLALLDQVTSARDGVRPPVVAPANRATLDDLRRFRHVVRHVYVDRLDARQLSVVMADLDGLWDRLATDLRVFAEFLRDVSAADDAMP